MRDKPELSDKAKELIEDKVRLHELDVDIQTSINKCNEYMARDEVDVVAPNTAREALYSLNLDWKDKIRKLDQHWQKEHKDRIKVIHAMESAKASYQEEIAELEGSLSKAHRLWSKDIADFRQEKLELLKQFHMELDGIGLDMGTYYDISNKDYEGLLERLENKIKELEGK